MQPVDNRYRVEFLNVHPVATEMEPQVSRHVVTVPPVKYEILNGRLILDYGSLVTWAQTQHLPGCGRLQLVLHAHCESSPPIYSNLPDSPSRPNSTSNSRSSLNTSLELSPTRNLNPLSAVGALSLWASAQLAGIPEDGDAPYLGTPTPTPALSQPAASILHEGLRALGTLQLQIQTLLDLAAPPSNGPTLKQLKRRYESTNFESQYVTKIEWVDERIIDLFRRIYPNWEAVDDEFEVNLEPARAAVGLLHGALEDGEDTGRDDIVQSFATAYKHVYKVLKQYIVPVSGIRKPKPEQVFLLAKHLEWIDSVKHWEEYHEAAESSDISDRTYQLALRFLGNPYTSSNV